MASPCWRSRPPGTAPPPSCAAPWSGSPSSTLRWPAPRAERRATTPTTRPERLPRCTIRTPGCPRSPRNSPGSVRRPGRRRRRPTGWSGSGRPPNSPGISTAPACPTWRTGSTPSNPSRRPEEVDPAERDALAERTALARQREVEARLVQRTAEERARATAGNAESLRRAARQERQHRLRVAAAEARRTASSAVADRVVEVGRRVRAAARGRRWPTRPPSGTGRPQRRAGADAALTAARARVVRAADRSGTG